MHPSAHASARHTVRTRRRKLDVISSWSAVERKVVLFLNKSRSICRNHKLVTAATILTGNRPLDPLSYGPHFVTLNADGRGALLRPVCLCAYSLAVSSSPIITHSEIRIACGCSNVNHASGPFQPLSCLVLLSSPAHACLPAGVSV